MLGGIVVALAGIGLVTQVDATSGPELVVAGLVILSQGLQVAATASGVLVLAAAVLVARLLRRETRQAAATPTPLLCRSSLRA
jgi:hypothetical protein